jgi:hypothetical protein
VEEGAGLKEDWFSQISENMKKGIFRQVRQVRQVRHKRIRYTLLDRLYMIDTLNKLDTLAG